MMITLLDYQEEAKAFLARRRKALVQSPAGSGKTIIAAAALEEVVLRQPRASKVRLGWMANTIDQCGQARAAIAKFPRLAAVIEATIECPAGMPDGAVFDVLIVDEAHHAPAETWRAIIEEHRGCLWLFTATPFGEDEDRNERLRRMVENQIHVVPRSAVADRVLPAEVVMLDESDGGLQAPIDAEIESRIRRAQRRPGNRMSYEELYQRTSFTVAHELGIQPNRRRNDAIVRLGWQHVTDSMLVLIHTIEHGEILQPRIPDSTLCFSKMGAKKRREAIAAFKAGDLHCLIATSLADEGLDVPIASVLILAGAGRSKSRVEQRTGRVLRAAPGKTHGIIYDFYDTQHRLLERQSQARRKTYEQLGYKIRDGGMASHQGFPRLV